MSVTSSPMQQPALDTSAVNTAPRRRRPMLGVLKGLLALIIVGAVAAAAWFGWTNRDVVASWLPAGPGGPDLLTYTVEPIDLRVTYTESGTLESANSAEVLCETKGQIPFTILSLKHEGTVVKAGDVVVELDRSALEDRQRQQQITVENARAAASKAELDLKVAESLKESDIDAAELRLEFAKLDLEQYIEGSYPQELKVLDTEIMLARKVLTLAEEKLRNTTDLRDKGFLTQGEYDSDKLEVTQSEAKLELAEDRRKQLEEYTFVRQKRDLESKVEEAQRHLARTNDLAAGRLEQARTDRDAKKSTLALEEGELGRISDQLEKCTIRAPQGGVVLYPMPPDDDAVELYIKPGNTLTEGRPVFSISDTDNMQISTSIHEAMTERVEAGMKARVEIDVTGQRFTGEVKWVSPIPDPEDWRKTTVKFYKTIVSLDQQVEGLRPGMSAKVEIQVDAESQVLAVPVQAVKTWPGTGKGVCYVARGSGTELRKLEVGKWSNKHIQVTKGLAAGERVVLDIDAIGIPVSVSQEMDRVVGGDEALPPVEIADGDGAEAGPEPVKTEYKLEVEDGLGFLAEIEYDFKTTPEGEVVKRDFEFMIVGGPPNAVWEVLVDGVSIGRIKLDSTGSLDFQWSTKNNDFPENFPEGVGTGSTIEIGDRVSGTFGAPKIG